VRQWESEDADGIMQDDASALHLPTLRRWNLVLRVFFVQYLGLRPEDAGAGTAKQESGESGAAAVQEKRETVVGRAETDLVSGPVFL
jgi:glutaminyl-peptide cyclotransferase